MDADTEKDELINWLKELDDPGMQENIKMLKDSTEGKDWFDQIPESAKKSIRRGTADLKEGRVYSSDEFWERIQKRRT